MREAIGDNYWTFIQNHRPDDADIELSLYVNARNNLLISGNAIKLAEFTVEVIFLLWLKLKTLTIHFSFLLMLQSEMKKFNFSVFKLFFNF